MTIPVPVGDLPAAPAIGRASARTWRTAAEISLVALAAGLLLGEGNQLAIQDHQTVAATTGEMGAPWVITAFAVGGFAAWRLHSFSRRTAAAAAAVGATALGIATLTYYRLGPNELLSGARHRYVVYWLVASLIIGAAAGVLGARWAQPGRALDRFVPALIVGSIIVGESWLARDWGWVGAGGAMAATVRALPVVGATSAAMLAPRRWRLGAAVGALVASWPIAQLMAAVLLATA